MSPETRVVIAAGGTAGHVQPAIVLAGALARRGAIVSFIGARRGFESRLVPSAGFALEAVDARPVFGVGWVRALSVPGHLLRGVAQARTRFLRLRPSLVVGFGGHASVAPMLAARSLGIPTALYEANVQPGLANAALAPCVGRVHVATSDTRWLLPLRSVRAVGHPIQPELDRVKGAVRALPRGRAARILVLGGSQGSTALNQHVPSLLSRLAERGLPLEVWHQAGWGSDLTAPRRRYEAANLRARVDGYICNVAASYRWADLAISSAGAGSLAELAAMGIPAVLVPLAKAARDHQTQNARNYARRTSALLWTEGDLVGEHAVDQLRAVLTDSHRFGELALRAAGAHQPGAAARLAASCIELAGEATRQADGALEAAMAPVPALLSRAADNDLSRVSSSTSRPARRSRPRAHNA